MNFSKHRIIQAVSLLQSVGIILLGVSMVYGATADDCKGIGIASCEIDGLDAMCDKLFSDPSESCDTICRSTVGDDEGVEPCVICCQNVKGQLDLGD